MNRAIGLGCALGLCFAVLPVQAAEPAAAAKSPAAADYFQQHIAPIFARRCLSCHNDVDRQGGLSFATAAAVTIGGDSGKVILPRDPAGSLLIAQITPQQGRAEMPPKADPLTAEERAAIHAWIASGAPWPADLRLEPARVVDTAWWSLAKLARPAIPALDAKTQAWVRNPIDAFIAAKLPAVKLSPAPEADRRALVRRLYFDLIGLPPTPAEVAAFVEDDHPRAYEQLVDRLLASPHYGERWARHWLDVVHFGETHGYDKDQPRPHAWPYRDYVIRALNADKPYAQFVAEQIAGDVLYPGTADGIEALGFLAAGPWDLIGHKEVPETKIDGQIARHLDRDDMVTTTISTFASLTVQCAQCHNHKFDPITQADYYSLQAVFAALDRADRRYDADPVVAAQRQALADRKQQLAAASQAIEARIQAAAGPPLAELDAKIAAAKATPGEHPPQHGYHSAIAAHAETVKWVQLDLGAPASIDRVELLPCHDDFAGIGAGFGFPVRYKIELSDDPEFQQGVASIFNSGDNDLPNPGLARQAVAAQGRRARYVRITATKLALRQRDYIFALAEVRVLDDRGVNRAAQGEVSALDSIEAPIRWRKQNLIDNLYPQAAAHPEELAAWEAQRQTLWRQAAGDERTAQSQQLAEELAGLEKSLAMLPDQRIVYAGVVHHGTGAFRGTGPDGGKPRAIHILRRGDVKQRGELVGPGAIESIAGLPARFDLPAEHAEGQRRAALAKWLTARENGIVWRSIVNRVWLYHFGRGLCDTPNDFGRMGQLPSHPELLEWLAVEFRDGGQSLKSLHRLLVTSATYRQSAAITPAAAAIDPTNIYYARMSRRKLEAEAIRDAVLAAAGVLDHTLYGPSFRDFVIEHPQHSPHYEYELFDPNDPQSHRRSIYRFTVRSQQQPLMAALDCADPSILVDKRNQSASALQALAMYNNAFMLVMAKRFAARVAAAGTLDAQVRLAWSLALARLPTDEEQAALEAYAKEHGMASACRVLFNLNAFVFVD